MTDKTLSAIQAVYDAYKDKNPIDAPDNDPKWRDQRWRYMVDGDCQKYGPLVFDQGLHRPNCVEKGFHKGLIEGIDLARENLTQPLTLAFYRQLHHTLCHHLPGSSDKFRNEGIQTSINVINHDEDLRFYFAVEKLKLDVENAKEKPAKMITSWLMKKRNQSTLGRLYMDCYRDFASSIKQNPLEAHYLKHFLELFDKQTEETIVHFLETHYRWGQKLLHDFLETQQTDTRNLNKYILELTKELGYHVPIVMISRPLFYHKRDCLHVAYNVISNALIQDKIVTSWFNKFNQEMKDITNKMNKPESGLSRDSADELKLRKIADLFQKLEWLHPFADGQGRTDLVLLSKLLTENGFHPVILREPYFSSVHTLDDWIVELKHGLKAWEDQLTAFEENTNSPAPKSEHSPRA